MGGSGGAVEMDETYIGRFDGLPKRRAGFAHKNAAASHRASMTGNVQTLPSRARLASD
jgi:hypothetical protein